MQTPLLPLKPTDYAALFVPKLLPTLVPPLAPASPAPSGGDGDPRFYFIVGVLLLVVVGGIYVINQNAQMMDHIKLITENSERRMPRPELTDSITNKQTNNETTTDKAA
jgi:hypothetical protein